MKKAIKYILYLHTKLNIFTFIWIHKKPYNHKSTKSKSKLSFYEKSIMTNYAYDSSRFVFFFDFKLLSDAYSFPI